MTSEPDAEYAKRVREAYGRWNAMDSVEVPVHRIDGWITVTALQTALRIGDFSDRFAEIIERVGRSIQDRVCDDPDLAAMSEKTWQAVRHGDR